MDGTRKATWVMPVCFSATSISRLVSEASGPALTIQVQLDAGGVPDDRHRFMRGTTVTAKPRLA
jgi:hypothetical protein